VIKRKYAVLSLLTLVSIVLGGLLYSNLVQAQTTVTGYVSVSAAAFVPMESTDMFAISDGLYNWDSDDVWFLGSFQLPNGATVTKVTFYWYDGGADILSFDMFKQNLTHSYLMAFNASSGAAGKGSCYDNTIENAIVDNSRYVYFFRVMIPPSVSHTDYIFYYAIIEYTLPSEGAVGGFWVPVDKFSLLAPYIALLSTIIVALSISVAYIKYRKK